MESDCCREHFQQGLMGSLVNDVCLMNVSELVL